MVRLKNVRYLVPEGARRSGSTQANFSARLAATASLILMVGHVRPTQRQKVTTTKATQKRPTLRLAERPIMCKSLELRLSLECRAEPSNHSRLRLQLRGRWPVWRISCTGTSGRICSAPYAPAGLRNPPSSKAPSSVLSATRKGWPPRQVRLKEAHKNYGESGLQDVVLVFGYRIVVFEYAIFVCPRVPQSIGGGHQIGRAHV